MALTPWWEAAFGEDYLAVYAHRDDAQGAAEIAGLLPHLRGPVLDAGCGGGRHLAALRAAGLPAVGFDLSQPLLESARQRPAVRGRVARGDLRVPPMADGAFGSVLVLFTGFGYFDDASNQATLTAIGRLLAPGGRLILDLPDPVWLRAHLVPHTERVTASGICIVESRQMIGTRVEKSVVITHPDGRTRAYTESVRLYDTLADLLPNTGLTVTETWPSLQGPRVDQHRQVWWLTAAKKPA